MSLELLVLVYVTFKRRKGIYFWSIIITNIGIILQTTGYILKEFENTCPVVLVTIICKVGWVANVTGFSVVLWSRLHLVVYNPRILRLVLLMIVINAICLHTPIVIFEFGLISRIRDQVLHPMEVMERVQQTIFTCQETIISCLYIYHTAKFLDVGIASHTRKVVALLMAVQILVISLDAGLTTFDYTNMFTLKCTVHPFVYSVKLKLEFIVLNQLLNIVKNGLGPGIRNRDLNFPTFVGPSGAPGSVIPPRDGNQHLKSPANQSVDFITRAIVVTEGPKSISSASYDKQMTQSGERSLSSSHGASTSGSSSVETDEHNLKDVIGKPDEDSQLGLELNSKQSIDDTERKYLGRYEV